MRVCITTTVHPPTDGRVFHREAVTLSQAGHEVFLLHQRGEGRETRQGVTIVGFPAPSSRAARAVGASGLVKAALELRPDVVHVHDPDLLAPGAKLCRGARVAFIYDAHEDYVGMMDHKAWMPKLLRPAAKGWMARQELRYVRQATGVVAADRQLAGELRRLNPNTVVAHNFPSKRLFPRPEASRRPEIVYEGSISPVRGAYAMIEVVRRVREKYPQVRLTMLGTIHAEEEEIRGRAAELGEGVVSIEDPVPYERLHERLAGATAGLALLERNRKFLINLPSKLFDYMACAVPYLASDFPNIRRVPGEVGGRLLDPRDLDGVAEIVGSFLKEPAASSGLGNRGRWAFEEKYNWEAESRGLLDMYERIAGERERAK